MHGAQTVYILALPPQSTKKKPVTERIVREIDAIVLGSAGCAILGAAQLQRDIDIVVATDEEKQLHDKRKIKKAARAKRAALQKRPDFLLDDIAEAGSGIL